MSEFSINSESCTEIARHWQKLATLLQQSPLSAEFQLRQPAQTLPPPLSFVRDLLGLCRSPEQKQLLKRHLLSSLLLFKDLYYSQDKLFQLCSFQAIFPGIDSNTIQALSWIAVPVAVVRKDTATKVSVLLGLKPGDGKCILQKQPLICSSSRQALQVLVPHDRDMFVWTLQHETDSALTGGSFGLPVVLAVSLLEKGEQWPQQLLATGAVSTGGEITAVQHIREKKRLLPRGEGIFLLPAENYRPDSDEHLIAIHTADEAVSVVNYIVRGRHEPKTIRMFQSAAQDADSLFDHLNKLPTAFFALHDLSPIYRAVQRKPEQYLGKLTSCLNKKAAGPSSLPDALVNLLQPDDIRKVAEQHPFTALQYSIAQLQFQNHCGHTGKSKQWSRLADKISSDCKAGIELTSLCNNDFVHNRFNHYDFRLELPEIFRRRLEHEKQLHDLQQDDSWQLGAMYGTIAQNYGFCGKAYLPELRKAVNSAINAFGSRYKEEHSRIQSYLLYGLLDTAGFAEIKALFPTVFSVAENPISWIREIFPVYGQNHDVSPFTVTLLCRLLAEQPTLLSRCSWAEERQNLIAKTTGETHHPWQLTAVNLARCCLFYKEKKQAVRLLEHAVAVCRKNGITMRAMALLPLSILHEHNFSDGSHINLAEKVITEIQGNREVKQSHFAELFSCETGEEILTMVQKNKRALFPFSYR